MISRRGKAKLNLKYHNNRYGVLVYSVVGNPLTSTQSKMAELLGCGIGDTANPRNVVIDKGHHCIRTWRQECYKFRSNIRK
jgi:hypothetical protein